MEENNRNGLREFFKNGKGDALFWGLIFLWGAMVLIFEITTNVETLSWWNNWSVFFSGFGALVILGGSIDIHIEDYKKAGWNFFIGFILLGFGLAGITAGEIFWVMVLLAISSSILVGLLNNQDESSEYNKDIVKN